jgi:glycosyltransferase involved in cell wall biosynthesis
VILLSLLRKPADRHYFSELTPYCEKVIGVEMKSGMPRKLFNGARSFFSDKRYMLMQYDNAELAQTLARVVHEERIDAVHAHFLHVGQYVGDSGDAAFVYDAHNLEHVLWERLAATYGNPLMRAFCRQQARKFVTWQQHVARDSEAIVTLSNEDRDEYLRIAPAADITTVPNGADIDFFAPQDVATEADSILYFGNFEWPPQRDAAFHFHSETLPLIKRDNPRAKLYLVGRDPSEELKRLEGDDVIVTGFVDDIRDAIAKCAVVVLPLRVGAGTKHRVFQTLAMKKPLVTTRVGAEGIDLVHGESAMIADRPEDFAACTLRLLADESLRRQMGENGRNLVEEQYNWELNYRKLETVFQNVTRDRSVSAR